MAIDNIIERARELRAMIEQLAQNLDDINSLANIELFPQWDGKSKEYIQGSKVKYNGKLYRVLATHTSQLDWDPENTVSLFAQVLVSQDGTPLPWVQPGSTNPYSKGDKVIFNDKIYESLIDNNVWSPADYPMGWKEITA